MKLPVVEHDLERARSLLADDPDEMDEAWLASIIAAARREGAAEMRERAAQTAEKYDCGGPIWDGIVADIRALPTAEETA